jgi:hypothetical protein
MKNFQTLEMILPIRLSRPNSPAGSGESGLFDARQVQVIARGFALAGARQRAFGNEILQVAGGGGSRCVCNPDIVVRAEPVL